MNITFKSCFAQEIAGLLTIKQTALSEKVYRNYRYNLGQFDQYLFDINLDKNGLTEEVINKWISTYKGVFIQTTINNKITVLREFVKYLHAEGISAYMPPNSLTHDTYLPYIYSQEDLEKIFELADSIPMTRIQPDKDIQIKYPTLLRMLYGCGFRLGEVISLKMKNLDLNLGTVRLENTKYNKERLVPMHPSLTNIMRKYCLLMGIIGQPDAWVFPGVDKTKHINERVVRRKYEILLKHANLSIPGREFQARGICLHCFRHLFAIRSFKQGDQQGWKMDTIIPYLSIYLGHKSLKETEKYLKFDATEIFPETMNSFNEFTNGMFPEVNYD